MVDFKNIIDLGGLVTNTTEDKIADRNASEVRNIDFSLKGIIQTKEGYGLVANEITAGGEILRTYVFKKNFGTVKRMKLRVRDDGTNSHLEWWNESNPDYSEGKWEQLVASLTQGAIMGFAPANGNNASKVNLLVFCNGVNNFSTWNGATATIASVTANTIVCNETLSTEGFTATGSILVDGTEYAYTGITAKTFTGVTPNPTVQNPTAYYGVAQKADTTTYSSLDKGNILLTTQGKLFLSGIPTNESLVTYSKTGDVTDFTSTLGGLGDAGDFDVMEGGGGINLLTAKGKNGLVIHKDDAVIQYVRDLAGDGTSVDEVFNTVTAGEDTGATNLKGESTLGQDSFYVTNFEGLKLLNKTLNGDDLQVNTLTSVILPTLKDWDFSDAAVIYYPNKRVIKCSAWDADDVRKTISYYVNTGDISIDDEPAADFMFVDRKLYFGSAYNQNVYEIGQRKSANGTGINHVYVTKEFSFSEPARDKEFNIVYVDGLIAASTKLKITVYYGILGEEGEKSYILSWDDKEVSDQKVSALGTEVLGEVSLGSVSDDISNAYIFSFPIHFDVQRSLRYKIKFETYYDNETQPDGEVYWAVINLSTNPTLKGFRSDAVVNSNL